MTVQNLPFANPASTAAVVEQMVSSQVGGGIQSAEMTELVQQALSLARNIAQDGKGYSLSYVRGALT